MARPTTKTVPAKTSNRARHGLVQGYRSGLEEQVAGQLRAAGVDPKYETVTIPYEKPVTKHKYTPDFPLSDVLIVETKGRFMPDDRKKHLLIKQQYPHLDIRFVFSNSKARISKASKTTYAMWCEKYGFKYADKAIPVEWLKELRGPLKRGAAKGKSHNHFYGKFK